MQEIRSFLAFFASGVCPVSVFSHSSALGRRQAQVPNWLRGQCFRRRPVHRLRVPLPRIANGRQPMRPHHPASLAVSKNTALHSADICARRWRERAVRYCSMSLLITIVFEHNTSNLRPTWVVVKWESYPSPGNTTSIAVASYVVPNSHKHPDQSQILAHQKSGWQVRRTAAHGKFPRSDRVLYPQRREEGSRQ